MSSRNVNDEKSPNQQLSADTNFPGYPTLPPPYSSVAGLAPQAPYAPSAPSAPSAPQAPQAPQAPPPPHSKSDEAKSSEPLREEEDDERRKIEFSPKPMRTTCPACKAEVITRTERHPTLRTHACACCLFWLVWWPCICLPYLLPGCNNVDHFCPNCDSYIGGFKC